MKMCLRPTWLMSVLLIPMGLMSARQIQHIFITTTDQVNADITDIDSKIIEINVIAVATSGLRPGPYQDLSLALQRLSLLMGRPACVWMVISKEFHIAVGRNSNRFLKKISQNLPSYLSEEILFDWPRACKRFSLDSWRTRPEFTKTFWRGPLGFWRWPHVVSKWIPIAFHRWWRWWWWLPSCSPQLVKLVLGVFPISPN